jgi:hypothetical protein
MPTTLHFGVVPASEPVNPDVLASTLHKHRIAMPYHAIGDSFTVWGERMSSRPGDPVHVTCVVSDLVSIEQALSNRAQLARILGAEGMRVMDYVVRTDAADYSERVAYCGVGALETDGGLWNACNL